MPDHRTKSIRVTEATNKAAKTLAAYLDKNMDEVVGMAIEHLWTETFPKVPMPAKTAKTGKRK